MTATRQHLPTVETMRKVVEQHLVRETAGDWAGTHQTMCDDPYYELYPVGVRIKGREAITAHWERLFQLQGMEADLLGRASVQQWYADEGYAVVMSVIPIRTGDGGEQQASIYAVYRFEGDLIKSETIYADNVFGPILVGALDEEFMSRPDVERL